MDIGYRQLTTDGAHPVRNLADARGLTVRTPQNALAVSAFNIVPGHCACCSADGSSCDTSIAFPDLTANKTASQGADCGSSSIFV